MKNRLRLALKFLCRLLALFVLTATFPSVAVAQSNEKLDAALKNRAQRISGWSRVIVEFNGEPDVRAFGNGTAGRKLGQRAQVAEIANTSLMTLAADTRVARVWIDRPVVPLFVTPAEMIDVAETELLAERNAATIAAGLPAGQDAPLTVNDAPAIQAEQDDWLARLSDFANLGNFPSLAEEGPKSVPIQDSLLPASFAVASYRASLLPLLGDAAEASLQGATAMLARLPIIFNPTDDMVQLNDPHLAAMSIATLSLDLESGPADE